jgi:type VI secretion system secreted protein Hcp
MRRKLTTLCLIGLVAGLWPSAAGAAEPVYLFLKAQNASVQGEVARKGLENSIEVLSYEQGVHVARDTSSGMATGRRQYEPIKIVKRIDRSSPLLLKALTQNQVVEGSFRFYRPGPGGTLQQFYTVEIAQGRVASVKQMSPDVMSPESQRLPALEEVTFVFNTIRWTFTDGGIQHEDAVTVAR